MAIDSGYQGTPYKDETYPGGPQTIPGRVMCAYFDFGGEGVAFHDTIPFNQGSGKLNPVDGSYLHSFRIDENVDTTYTKTNDIDDTAYNLVLPEMGVPYVGWTEPGEWTKYTVEVKQTGRYGVSLLYTSNRGGEISLSVNDKDATGPIPVPSTFDAEDPVAFRQWHHWNLLKDMAFLHLEQGEHVLTLHTVSEGQMNYCHLEFELRQDGFMDAPVPD